MVIALRLEDQMLGHHAHAFHSISTCHLHKDNLLQLAYKNLFGYGSSCHQHHLRPAVQLIGLACACNL